MTDKLYEGFHDPSDEFSREPRAFCYEVAQELIEKSKRANRENWYEEDNAVKGILLLLFTWNFAARQTKKLDFEKVRGLIRQNGDKLRSLEDYSIETLDENDENAWTNVRDVFDQFRRLLDQTGASKALSLLNPDLFVMWDTAIRERLDRELIEGIDKGRTGDHYVTFLKGIQRIIGKYGIKDKLPAGKNYIIAKKIDEYHYVELVMKKKK